MTIVARELVRDAQNRPRLPAPCRVNERSGGEVRPGGAVGGGGGGPPGAGGAPPPASRPEPPGWTIALMPASSNSCGPSGNGKNASDAATEPAARSPARSTARRGNRGGFAHL